jgi:hypothetical protein
MTQPWITGTVPTRVHRSQMCASADLSWYLIDYYCGQAPLLRVRFVENVILSISVFLVLRGWGNQFQLGARFIF